MEDSATERALHCPVCGRTVYPRINPAVIVAITDGDRLLLTKYANRPFRRYALVAGFCEIGESVEDTVRREVWEEVGLQVTRLRFYRSQPWGPDGQSASGLFLRRGGGSHPHAGDGELALAQWVPPGGAPGGLFGNQPDRRDDRPVPRRRRAKIKLVFCDFPLDKP